MAWEGGGGVRSSLPHVFVRDPAGLEYACQWWSEPLRAKCGKCGRGVVALQHPDGRGTFGPCRVCDVDSVELRSYWPGRGWRLKPD